MVEAGVRSNLFRDLPNGGAMSPGRVTGMPYDLEVGVVAGQIRSGKVPTHISDDRPERTDLPLPASGWTVAPSFAPVPTSSEQSGRNPWRCVLHEQCRDSSFVDRGGVRQRAHHR